MTARAAWAQLEAICGDGWIETTWHSGRSPYNAFAGPASGLCELRDLILAPILHSTHTGSAILIMRSISGCQAGGAERYADGTSHTVGKGEDILWIGNLVPQLCPFDVRSDHPPESEWARWLWDSRSAP
jgi:hypothetical protein